ncbi:MAG: beta-lactamase domain protein [Mucilaginibacter sp.]|nr:beta-lactamase domain protein [Mucilaginibacter sp.]
MKHSNNAYKAFLKTAGATFLLLGTLMASPFSASAQALGNPDLTQAGYYRMKVGDFEVTALSDGTVPQNFHQLLTNAKPGEVDSLLKQNYQTDPVELSVNAYLIKNGDKLILVDAGTAGAYGPTLGHLTESLARSGYKPEQIDAVLITHIHIDHTGGLMDGARMAFPNATIYISKTELDFWLSPESKANAPESLKTYYAQAEATVGPYLKAGKVKAFGNGKELFPGITPIATPGHTPGHTSFMLESGRQKLVFWGDIMHAAAVQFVDPSVTIVYDVDPQAAAIQRKKAFIDAAKNGYWVAGDHLSYPGIGHIRANGSSYIWIPANYSTYSSGK